MTMAFRLRAVPRRRHTAALLAILLTLAGLAFFAPAGGASTPAKKLHVATWGKDSWNGTADRPFATLQRAQESVRSRTPGMRSDIVVNIHPGTYALSAPLQLRGSAGDSGRNGHSVIWQADGYGSHKQWPVILSGGRRVVGWQLDDAVKNIWRAQVGSLDTRQLYVNGVRATRARNAAGAAVGLPGTLTLTDAGYVTTSIEPQSWSNPGDIELVLAGNGFSDPRCGVAAISGNATSTTITMEQPCHRWYVRNHAGVWGNEEDGRGTGEDAVYKPKPPTHAENSKSFLTEPGTFYLDRSNPGKHTLFYIPRAGENLKSSEVIAPVLETLVEGVGTPGDRLHDVTFRGLTFTYATWMGPSRSTGFVQSYGSMYEGGDAGEDPEDPWDVSDEALQVPGAVRFLTARRIVLENNRFQRLGGEAIELAAGTAESVVRGNRVEDISGGGIQIATRRPGPDLALIQSNPDNVVENNLVRQVGLEYTGSIGIYAELIQRARIAHNQLDDLPYTGISFGEYWTHHPVGETVAFGNRILGNHVFDYMKVARDGAGIFTSAHQGTSYANGTLVRGNLIHDLTNHGVAFYLDDDANFNVWQGNAVYRMGDRGAVSGCPLNNVVTQNYLDFVEPTFWCERGGVHVVYEGNTELTGDGEQACAAIAGCAAVQRRAGLEPRWQHLLSD